MLALTLGGVAGAQNAKPAAVPKVPAFAQARLSPVEWEAVRAMVQPGKERWAEIPWETDLGVARKKAAATARPLLMWVMDGHPLGCT